MSAAPDDAQLPAGALAGITVLDLGTRLPGPLATLLLAQAGARVIKIERPPGEDLRQAAPQLQGMSAHYLWMNRGKQCVALDLKQAEGRAAFLRLAAQADVLVEQFRPGVMARLGLGYEDLAKEHPQLVYCAISGYGRDDPRSQEAAHDLNYQASTGMAASGGAGVRGVPMLPTPLLGDIAGGSYPAVMSILAALIARGATGRGCFLDIAMAQNTEVLSLWPTVTGHLTGRWPVPGAGRHTGGLARYNLYAARDGRLLALGALEDAFFRNFLAAIGLDMDPEMEQRDPQGAIALIAARLATRDAADWLARFAGRDTCCTLAPTLSELHPANGAHAESSLPAIRLPLAPQLLRSDVSPPVRIDPA